MYSQFNSIENNKKFNEYKTKIKEQIDIKDLNNDKHFKFYYLYKNFQKISKRFKIT